LLLPEGGGGGEDDEEGEEAEEEEEEEEDWGTAGGASRRSCDVRESTCRAAHSRSTRCAARAMAIPDPAGLLTELPPPDPSLIDEPGLSLPPPPAPCTVRNGSMRREDRPAS